MATEESRSGKTVAAVLLVSAAAMAYEIFLIRLLALRYWPHFVPLIVSQAMLGFGAAGAAIHLARSKIEKAPGTAFAWLVLLSSPSFDLAFRSSGAIPFDPYLLLWEPASWPAFGLFFVVLSVPFFLAGAAVAVPFSFRLGTPGPVYAASFGGSAAGALLALGAFRLVPAEMLLFIPQAIGLAAGALVLKGHAGKLSPARMIALAVSVIPFALPPPGPPPSPYKDLAVTKNLPEARTIARRFGASGDCHAVFAPGIHSAPGLGLLFTGEIPPQAALFCDGEARGIVPRGAGGVPPAYLGHFPQALAYRLASRPAVLQFGMRGTEGILAAALGGASSITVVEPSAELAGMVVDDLAAFSGGLPSSPPIAIRTDGARNFLARGGPVFDLIEVPDISSATFSSLGIHATGETFLLTREGVRSALSRLARNGLLSFSGWLKSPPRESVKILSTLRLELEKGGSPSAADSVIMARGWGTFVILARREPFTARELLESIRFCEEKGFTVVWPPASGSLPGSLEEESLRESAERAIKGTAGTGVPDVFDLSPVTDDSPYFHRFLKIRSLPEFQRILGSQWVPFVEWGVVFLLLSLAVSAAIAGVCLLLPLAFARLDRNAGGWAFAAYFGALGLAYMLIQLTYLKIGVLLLGEPVTAAAAAIGGFSLFSGLGSAASGGWVGEKTMRRKIFPAVVLLAAAGFLSLSLCADVLLASGGARRATAFVASLAPAAFLMGVPFPAALSRLSVSAPASIPFAWGINGFFSVAGASLASVCAMWGGFRGAVAAGCALYMIAGALYSRLGGDRDRE